jgi:hypothetical protein
MASRQGANSRPSTEDSKSNWSDKVDRWVRDRRIRRDALISLGIVLLTVAVVVGSLTGVLGALAHVLYQLLPGKLRVELWESGGLADGYGGGDRSGVVVVVAAAGKRDVPAELEGVKSA